MNCACGKPLHYSDAAAQRQVQRLVDKLGEYTMVTIEGRTWRVQRHYIALHGLKAHELPLLGFREVAAEEPP